MQGLRHSKWALVAHTTSSTSVSEAIDMQGFEGVEFVGVAGSSSGAITLTLAHGASTTGFVNMTGATHATTGGADFAIVDVYRPRKRYVRGTLTTAAAGDKILMARRYGPKNLQLSTTYGTAVVSPDT